MPLSHIEDVQTAFHHQIDAPERDEHTDDGEGQQPGQLPTTPAHRDAQVQRDAVDQPGQQRPGLDRIPGPVRAPQVLGPDRTRGDHDRVGDEPEHRRAEHQFVHSTQCRSRSSVSPTRLDQVHDRRAAGDRVGPVGQPREKDVDVEPERL